MFQKRKANSIFYIIIIGTALYYISFIMRTSFIVNGVKYFTLFDDAMIAMQYAKNLVHGYGLVWNPEGPRVEGYTNLLWVLYMAFWHLFPISSAKICLPIQLTELIFLIGSLFLIKRIADYISGGNKYVSIGAVLLAASYQPISFYALKGMGTSIGGFIVLLAVWRVLSCLKERNFDPLLFVILGIGVLFRIDFALLFIAIALFVIIAIPENRKKNALLALFIFLLIMGTTTLFRWFYYKDILPNTYYTKVTGVPLILRVQRGLWVNSVFIKKMSLVLFILPFIYCVLQLKNKKTWFLLYLFLIQLFYSIYVGGDDWAWWGNLADRYLCIVMPLFFILISLAVNYLIKGFATYSNIVVALKKCCFAVLIVLIIIQLHGGYGQKVFEHLIKYPGIKHVEDDKMMVRIGLKLNEITSPDAKIAVDWAGAIPYFSDRHYVDLLSKNDAFIARQKAKVTNFREFLPGHNKWDFDYSIGKFKPDIVEVWCLRHDAALPYLKKYKYKPIKIHGLTLYFRKNSPNIDWTKIKNIPPD